MSEDIALNTTLLYPTSKLMAEELCRSFNATYGMPITIFRFANVYGEGSDESLNREIWSKSDF